jgi:glycosyltransferase involved in cell wall biosynthesis
MDASWRADYPASMTAISLVVPAWNEAERLPTLLASVATAAARLPAGAVEVIVADNDSTDATAAVAAAHGAKVPRVTTRCIAAARNGGAALAEGSALAFVDADSRVHPDSLAAVVAALADARIVGGASGVTMERWSAGIAATYAMMLPVVWLTGFDTGLVFCRRADFETLGGYDENRLVAEDVDFLLRLRRLGRSRGQRLCRLQGVKAVTSTRKFDRHGDWHYFTRMPALAWRLLRDRRALTELAQRYWYEDR